MKCVFCQGEIKTYLPFEFEITTRVENVPDGVRFAQVGYPAALIECPHCDMIFFLKPNSKKLEGMTLINQEEFEAVVDPYDEEIRNMTSEEKRALYEKIKRELIEKYT